MRSQINISSGLMQSLTACLEELCRAVDAQQAVLFSPMGQPLVCHGGTEGLDLNLLLPLFANGIGAIQEAYTLLEQETGFSLYYHAGSNFDLYGAPIHHNLMILLKLDRPQNQTRIGTVLYAIQQAIKALRSVFPDLSPGQEADLEDPDNLDQLIAAMESAVQNPPKAIDWESSEVATQSDPGDEVSQTKQGRLLSYAEAETQGLIRDEP